jgi:hypothetical protein
LNLGVLIIKLNIYKSHFDPRDDNQDGDVYTKDAYYNLPDGQIYERIRDWGYLQDLYSEKNPV